ncbi:SURP and G-patch domain-containing protein 1-like protein [Chenopodium quinoa]|uniref:SURP and G-patch domain-containing protein 1-like protein n=1 Tax=Chenopodium quinoa TaxID=63459 RepID=UPI000B77CAED|nr:SURP and G-patch domain-containing protein 1-like protein [Chenopodium quinoa]XP_021765391.1 SURP and G-patch domain-containing protein 1-like protein [Chenopodium quinoa]XP_021765392.1 SURP and G-patch domain-containing protein 1-like protein [Chenopodium quinoa]
MDKGVPPTLFVNDGSFMEKFKQLHQDKEKGAVVEDRGPKTNLPRDSTPNTGSIKIGSETKHNNQRKTTSAASGGKLAFSLKQKSKLVVPSVKLSEDDDEDDAGTDNGSDGVYAKRQKLGQSEASVVSSRKFDVAPPSPSDPAVKKAADRLASFVAKKGRQIEDITRQKNPGNTPFRFLFDEACTEFKYYEYRIQEEEKALALSKELQTTHSGDKTASASIVPRMESNPQLNYHTPASALYDVNEASSFEATSARSGESSSSFSGSDPIAMMEYYMKKAAAEEKKRPPKQSRDEMPPPASLQVQAAGKRGHHMGDYIPPEELEGFLAKCNDAAAQKAAKEAADKAKIQADNVGHKLLSKMGWKEGEGLGSSRKGIADPISAGNVKKDHLGVGAQQPGEVTPEDDIYEQYKKRMMLGYRHRPNPLNNPRKAYY